MMKAIEYGDSDMKLLHSRIVKVRPELRNRLLTLYVVRCRALYQIAFYQYRKMFPSKVRHDINEIEGLLESRLAYQFTENRVNMWAKASEKTKYEAKLKQYNIKYLKKYGLADE